MLLLLYFSVVCCCDMFWFFFVFFFLLCGHPRDLPRVGRRRRKVCIRNRAAKVMWKVPRSVCWRAVLLLLKGLAKNHPPPLLLILTSDPTTPYEIPYAAFFLKKKTTKILHCTHIFSYDTPRFTFASPTILDTCNSHTHPNIKCTQDT